MQVYVRARRAQSQEVARPAVPPTPPLPCYNYEVRL